MKRYFLLFTFQHRIGRRTELHVPRAHPRSRTQHSHNIQQADTVGDDVRELKRIMVFERNGARGPSERGRQKTSWLGR